MIEVVGSPAGDTNLILRDTVKLRLGMKDASEDATVDLMIRWASEAIVEHLGRDLVRQRYHETTSGHGDQRIALSRYPVETSLVVVKLLDSGTDPITDFSVDDAKAGILYREIGWRWSAQRSGRFPFFRQAAGTETHTIDVLYTAGYVLPGDSTATNSSVGPYLLHSSIEAAAFEAVKAWWLIGSRDPLITNRQSSTGSRRAEATDPFVEANVQYIYDKARRGGLPPESLSFLRYFKHAA